MQTFTFMFISVLLWSEKGFVKENNIFTQGKYNLEALIAAQK